MGTTGVLAGPALRLSSVGSYGSRAGRSVSVGDGAPSTAPAVLLAEERPQVRLPGRGALVIGGAGDEGGQQVLARLAVGVLVGQDQM